MNTDNKSILARNLQYYMNKHGIDRHQLCEALNFKYSTVSEWLSAKKYPRIDRIEAMANYFGIAKSDLIEDKIINSIPSESSRGDAHSRIDELFDDELVEALNYIDFLITKRDE